MSFSMEVKQELLKQISPAKHCRIAEIAAFIAFSGRYSEKQIAVETENLTVAVKYYILLEKTFKINAEVLVRRNNNSIYYHVIILNEFDVKRVLKAVKLISDNGGLSETGYISSLIMHNICCKRAFLRGVFMAAGSITDPEKSYHFEITCSDNKKAEKVSDVLRVFDVEPRETMRKKNYIVYLKEGSQISDVLNIMSAHVALMRFENVRIVKEMRNHVNRMVNCDAANISKATLAGRKQIKDIMYIRDNMGIGNLPDQLQEIARLRLENPEVALKELGELLQPPLGKSGVNHRLRRLGEIADRLRKQKEEKHDIQTD